MAILPLYFIFSMLAVMWLDTTRFTIPNWLVGSLLLLYPVAVYMNPHAVDWKMALAGAGIVLVLGYIVFAMKWMGAGDIKLLIALALWVGWTHLLEFIFLVSLIGGAFALALWGGRKLLPHIPHKGPLPRILREGEPVAYGVAIASGFLITMWLGQVAAL